MLCGLEASSCSSSCKIQAVCERDYICTARGMLQNIGLHTTVWEEDETVLMVLTNLNISYWCDEVLTEQGLPFILGNNIAAVFRQSQQKGRGELMAPVLSQSCNKASGGEQC